MTTTTDISTLDAALEHARDGDILDAIRLALFGSANDETAIQVIQRLAGERASFPDNTLSTHLLVLAVRELGGAFTTESPR